MLLIAQSHPANEESGSRGIKRDLTQCQCFTPNSCLVPPVLQTTSEGRLKVTQGAGGQAGLELGSAHLRADSPSPGSLPDHPMRLAGLAMTLVTQIITQVVAAAARFIAPCQALCEALGLHTLSPPIAPSMT